MLKTTLSLLSFCLFTYADTIDKKKILDIIKAAKQHKSVPSISKPKVVEKKSTPSAPIIVYRKRTKPVVYHKKSKTPQPSLIKKDYGTLPALAPSSVTLKEKFEMKKNSQNTNAGFHTPMKRNPNTNTINTVARKINL